MMIHPLRGGGCLHALKRLSHANEFGMIAQGVKPGIGQHLEEPWAMGLRGGLQTSNRALFISQHDGNSRTERTRHESLTAQPLQTLQNRARFSLSSATCEGVSMDGGAEIEVWRSANQVFSDSNCAFGMTIECQ